MRIVGDGEVGEDFVVGIGRGARRNRPFEVWSGIATSLFDVSKPVWNDNLPPVEPRLIDERC
jgi:hypothetical protein